MKQSSKLDLLKFALPALGISLAGPILSNIDNAFVGRLAGASALASLSPGTVVADNILYLLVFLPRATVGLVSRAFATGGTNAARGELERVLSVALPIGLLLTLFYQTCTPWALRAMGVAPELLADAGAYARVRGLVTWAALAQNICLSALLATRDSVTPLKVVTIAAVVNLCGNFLLCAWPLRLGVAGAAASTSVATLVGCALMVRALWRKGLLPRRWPHVTSLESLRPLSEYAGPLSIVIGCRVLCLASMALAAAPLGTTALAAYQVLINLLSLFGLFGEPLGQTAQATLPPLLEKGSTRAARGDFLSLLSVGLVVAVLAGGAAALMAYYGGPLFSQDPAVLAAVRSNAPVLMLVVSALVIAYAVDGAVLAARDFRFLILSSLAGLLLQLPMLVLVVRTFGGGHASLASTRGLAAVFLTLAVRLLSLDSFCLVRLLRSSGPYSMREGN